MACSLIINTSVLEHSWFQEPLEPRRAARCEGSYIASGRPVLMRSRRSPQETALPGEEPSSEGDRGRRSALSLRGVPVHGRRAHPAVRSGLGTDQHRLRDVLAYTAGERRGITHLPECSLKARWELTLVGYCWYSCHISRTINVSSLCGSLINPK